MAHCKPSPPSAQYSTPPTIVYEIDQETGGVLIPLSGKKFAGLFAVIDSEDVERVIQQQWSASRKASSGNRVLLYAKCRLRGSGTPGKYVYLHRFILRITDPRVKVDHENHNSLDCRKANMRLVTHQQNIFNRRPNLHATSQYKGVHHHSQCDKWQSTIKHDGKVRHLGLFTREIDAALAYDSAAREVFGHHAFLNFPDIQDREVD